MIASVGLAVSLIGWLIVIGCLIAAAFAGFRAAWLPCVLLLVTAIIAAALLAGA